MIDVTSLRIGIDIGGTFTDFVTYSPDSGNVLQALDEAQVVALVELLRHKNTQSAA